MENHFIAEAEEIRRQIAKKAERLEAAKQKSISDVCFFFLDFILDNIKSYLIHFSF